MNTPRQAYLETHSALNRALLAYGLWPLAAEAACLAAGLAARQPWFFVIMAGLLIFVMISAGLLYRNWPTGIRIDESGITIGAVQSARAARRRPTVTHQSRGLYTCPWPAVLDARTVTDPDELRRLKTDPRYFTLTNRWGSKLGVERCNIGVLVSPLMRAALVIEVNPAEVTASKIRPARYYSNFKDGRFSYLIRPQPSPTWIVPTRHPEALSAALRAVAGKWHAVSGPESA
jgi:hypothetical protein